LSPVSGLIVNAKFFSLAAVAALSLSLAACGSTEEPPISYEPPAPHAPVDPTDAQLVAAIQQHLKDINGPLNSQYEYVRVDLNNDGLREGLVLFNLPHTYWCGWSGCAMEVFQAGDNSFKMVSQTDKIRGPIVVGQTSTNGWDDLIVRLSGTEYADQNIVLKYDGNAYPQSPVNQEELPYDIASITGLRLFP